VGNVDDDRGIKGLRDSKLKSGLPKGLSPRIWNEDSNINGKLPYLVANPPNRSNSPLNKIVIPAQAGTRLLQLLEMMLRHS
jgi:hypothetical protein